MPFTKNGLSNVESSPDCILVKLTLPKSLPSIQNLPWHGIDVELSSAGGRNVVPNIVCTSVKKCERLDEPLWVIGCFARNTEEVQILRSFSVKSPKTRNVPFDERRLFWIKRTTNIGEADEFRVVGGKTIEDLIHLGGIALTAGIFIHLQLATNSSDNNVEPKVLDAETQFESGILKSCNIGSAFGVVEPRNSLPKMPPRIEEPFAIDDLLRRPLLMLWHVH